LNSGIFAFIAIEQDDKQWIRALRRSMAWRERDMR
jgi:hypothetical protein